MKKPEALYLTANQVDKALRTLYAKNGYVLLSQIRNGTGFERSPRTADVLAVSTWPSRGLFAEGFEIKVNRSDLWKELAAPEKADEIAKYCRRWWLAQPAGLVTEDMLIPPTWGIISVDEKLKATVTKAAVDLAPVPMDTLFVCAVLRNFAENTVPMAEVNERISAACEQAKKDAASGHGYRLKALEKAVQEFKDASGVDLMNEYGRPEYDCGGIGEAVKLVRDLHYKPLEEIRNARDLLAASVKALEALMPHLVPKAGGKPAS